MRECWAKNHNLKEEKWHFLKISNWYCVFELRSLKLPLTPTFSLIHPKTKKQWRLSFSWVVVTSKWRLWRHTLEIWNDVIKIFLIWQDFYPLYIPIKFQHDLTWIRKKFWKICLFDHVFSQALPFNWLPWQQWMTYTFYFKNGLYNGLKSHKVSWRSAKPFLRYLAKTLRGPFCPPPVQIGLMEYFIVLSIVYLQN